MILNKLTKTSKDLMCDSAVLDIIGTLKEARDKKPSKIIDDMMSSIMEITYHINDFRIERSVYEETLSRLNVERIEALEKIKQLEAELYGYNNPTEWDGLE